MTHAKLLRLGKGRRAARRLWQLIERYRKAGGLTGDGFAAPVAGTPPGGPLAPLVANLLLDVFDQELERRGHRVVGYAAERHSYVKSRRAGQRVLASVTRFLERPLKLPVQAAKRAVDRPGRRTFLGVPFPRRRPNRPLVRANALQALKLEVRQRPGRTRGVAWPRVVDDLRQSLKGWDASCHFAEGQSSCKELASWVRRRRRCYVWQQWGRRRYRELRQRGGSQALAWNTCKSAHGPWRLSRSPALAMALPGPHFDRLGVPRL